MRRSVFGTTGNPSSSIVSRRNCEGTAPGFPDANAAERSNRPKFHNAPFREPTTLCCTASCFSTRDRIGSISAANFRDRHGRTCFNTGRQGTRPLRHFLIDEMAVSAIGKRGARSTPVSGRHGQQPWIPRWATSGLPHCNKRGGRDNYTAKKPRLAFLVSNGFRPAGTPVGTVINRGGLL